MNREIPQEINGMPPLVRFTSDIMAVIFLLVTPVISYWGGTTILKSWRAARWPTTEATVIHCERKSLHRSSEPIVQYVFEINGRQYESDSIRIHDGAGKYKTFAEQVVRAFPKGSKPMSVTIPTIQRKAASSREFSFAMSPSAWLRGSFSC